MIDFEKIVDSLIQEALIHKVSSEGDMVGAYEYRNNDPNQGVQPVELHKSNVERYYHKLLDKLPSDFKGKKPIGRIGPDFGQTKEIQDLQGHEILDPTVSDPGVKGVDWEKGKILSNDELDIHKQLEKEAREAAKGAKYNKPFTPKDAEELVDFFDEGPQHVDTLAMAFKPTLDKFKKAFGVESNEDLKKIVQDAHLAKKSLGKEWATLYAKRHTEPTTKKSSEKNKLPQTAPESELENLPATRAYGLGHITYSGKKGLNTADLDYLAQMTNKTISDHLESLEQTNPKLAKTMESNLGSHWKNLLYLARNAKFATKQNLSLEDWKKTLINNPLLSVTGLDQLDNIEDIADAVYKVAKTNIPEEPKPADPPDTHYHADGDTFEYSSEDLNKAIADVGTSNPYSLLYQDPKKAKALRDLFGPNWGVLLSVAQRINKHKANGDPNPIGTVKKEYGKSLSNVFGADWESTLSKVADSLGPLAQITHKDQSLNKKDQTLASLDASYNDGKNVFQPDLQYLRDIALPSLADKTDAHLIHIGENNPGLSKDLEEKLGPSWFYVLTIGRRAKEAALKGHDPYREFTDIIQNDPTHQAALQKHLGSSYIDVISNVIQAATGIKPPATIDQNLATSEYAAQPDQENIPTNTNQNAVTQQDVPAINPQGNPPAQPSDPNAAQPEEPIQNPEEVPTRDLAALPAQTGQNSSQTQQELPSQQAGEPQEMPQDIPQNPQEYPTIQPDQPPTPPVPPIPQPQPIEGGGSVPQSHQSNIDSAEKEQQKDIHDTSPDLPTLPALSYENGGITTEITPDQIERLWNLHLDESDFIDPNIRAQMSQTYGKSWKKVYHYVNELRDELNSGKTPPENLKTFIRAFNKRPADIKKTEAQFGKNWEQFLHGLVDTVIPIWKSQKGAQPNPEETPTRDLETLPTRDLATQGG